MKKGRFSPIVFSQKTAPEEEALRTGIPHALLNKDTISVFVPEEGKVKIKEISLPGFPFRLNDIGSHEQYAWKLFVLRIQEEIVPDPVMIIDHDHPLKELMIFANGWNGLAYGLRFDAEMANIRVIEYALLGNSTINLFVSKDIEADFRKKYIGPYRSANSLAQLEKKLDDLDTNQENPGNNQQELSQSKATEATPVKLLIVSYFSGECRSVAVQRINYWVQEIANLSEGKVQAHLATATNFSVETAGGAASAISAANRIYIPDHHIATLEAQFSEFPEWGEQFVATEKRNARSFNTLAYYWRIALENYFENSAEQYDVVLISGNPFACFDFAAFAKLKWQAKVILDYRDPFANNPRFLYRHDQREAARYVERGYNFQADVVLSVNSACEELVEARQDVDTLVIPNGFDERISNKIKPIPLTNDVINFVHAGSFYYYGSPKHFLNSMDSGKHSFHHIGTSPAIEKELLDHNLLVLHGRKTYPETLALVGGGDCGIVFLSESNFETTTKIFDYIAMGIDILLCTQGEPKQGVLNQILAGYPGVYWCKNTAEGVAGFLSSYTPIRQRADIPKDRFSRGYGTQILINKIYELVGL